MSCKDIVIFLQHRNNFEYFYLSVHMYVQLSDPSSFFLFLMKDYKQIDLDEWNSLHQGILYTINQGKKQLEIDTGI